MKLNAFRQRSLVLRLKGRHFRHGAPIDHSYAGRPQAHSCPRGVHRHVTSANNQDFFALFHGNFPLRQLSFMTQGGGAQKIAGLHNALQVFARQIQLFRQSCSGADKDSVKPLLKKLVHRHINAH